MTGSDLSSSGGASRPEPPKGAAGQAVRGALGHAVVLAFLGYFFLPAYVPFNTTAVLAAGLGLKLQQTDVPRFLAAVGAVLGVVTGGIGGWTARSRSLRRNAEVQSVAAGVGGTYTAQSGAELGSWLRPFFANASFVEVTNLVRLDDERVWVADAHVKYHRSRGSTLNTRPAQPSDQTVACLDAGELALPEFTLQPEGFLVNALSRAVGVEDIDFSSQTEFSGKYHLSAVHAENTRRLFDSSLLAVLARTNGLHMQCRRDGLVLYRPKQVLDSADFKAFTTEALTILRLVKQSAASLAATGPLAAATGTDVNALAKNMPGMMGKLVRARLVVRADVAALLQQAPPRKVPDNIRKQVDGGVDLGSMFAFILLTFGVASTSIISNQQPADAASPASRFMFIVGILSGTLGAWILFRSVRSRYRQNALLRSGHVGSAKIVSLDATGVEIDGEKQYRMNVEFQALGRAVTATTKIRGDAVFRAKRLMQDGKPAVILYDRSVETRILYADSLMHVSPEYEP